MLPLIVSIYAVWVAALWWLTDWKNSDLGTAGVFMFPFAFFLVPQLVRYMVAGDAHQNLKEKFGDLYAEKIRRGEISLGALSVMLNRAPERYEKMLASCKFPANLNE